MVGVAVEEMPLPRRAAEVAPRVSTSSLILTGPCCTLIEVKLMVFEKEIRQVERFCVQSWHQMNDLRSAADRL